MLHRLGSAAPLARSLTRRLVLVRHASTAAVRAAAFGADEPLDEAGRVAAGRLARRLPRRGRGARRADPARPRDRGVRRADRVGRGARARSSATSAAGAGARCARWPSPTRTACARGSPSRTPRRTAARRSRRCSRAWPPGSTSQAGRERTAIAITHGGVVKAAVVGALGAPPAAFWRIDVAPAGDHRAARARRALDRRPRERPRGRAMTAAPRGHAHRGRRDRRRVLADAVLGDPRRGHPVAGFGRVAAALERRAHRDSVRAGAVYAALLAGAVTAAAAAAERALRGRPRALAALRAACLWTALGGRSLGREAHAVAALVDARRDRRRRGGGCARSSAATRRRSTAPGCAARRSSRWPRTPSTPSSPRSP